MKVFQGSIPFEPGSNSQIGQESFVLFVLDKKFGGSYLEIGASDPIEISNTYILESRYKWKGISIEWNQELTTKFNGFRQNPCLCLDATKTNYKELLKKFSFPHLIDYLQVDIEPPANTFKALYKVLKSGYKFKVVTFEHDLYASKINLVFKILAKLFLYSYGYRLVANNVRNGSASQEDWYLNREIRPDLKLRKNQDFRNLFA